MKNSVVKKKKIKQHAVRVTGTGQDGQETTMRLAVNNEEFS